MEIPEVSQDSIWYLPEDYRAFINRFPSLVEWWLGQNPLDVHGGFPQRTIRMMMLLEEQGVRWK